MSPKIEMCLSEEQLLSKADECEKAGRRVIKCNILEDGIIGKMAFFSPPEGQENTWTEKQADMIWLTWEKFGRVLKPKKTLVENGRLLFGLYNEHQNHDLIGYTNAEDRTVGFICYCKADEGKSLVFYSTLSVTKEIPNELRSFIESDIY